MTKSVGFLQDCSVQRVEFEIEVTYEESFSCSYGRASSKMKILVAESGAGSSIIYYIVIKISFQWVLKYNIRFAPVIFIYQPSISFFSMEFSMSAYRFKASYSESNSYSWNFGFRRMDKMFFTTLDWG